MFIKITDTPKATVVGSFTCFCLACVRVSIPEANRRAPPYCTPPKKAIWFIVMHFLTSKTKHILSLWHILITKKQTNKTILRYVRPTIITRTPGASSSLYIKSAILFKKAFKRQLDLQPGYTYQAPGAPSIYTRMLLFFVNRRTTVKRFGPTAVLPSGVLAPHRSAIVFQRSIFPRRTGFQRRTGLLLETSGRKAFRKYVVQLLHPLRCREKRAPRNDRASVRHHIALW